MSARPKDDPSTEKFLEYFYKNAVDILLKPLHDIPDFRKQTGRFILLQPHNALMRSDQPVLKLSRERTNLLLYLCDLLCIFAQQHMFRSHFYILSSDISTRVATLLSARDKHLRLCMLYNAYFSAFLMSLQRRYASSEYASSSTIRTF